jgi:hypothetical protein
MDRARLPLRPRQPLYRPKNPGQRRSSGSENRPPRHSNPSCHQQFFKKTPSQQERNHLKLRIRNAKEKTLKCNQMIKQEHQARMQEKQRADALQAKLDAILKNQNN